MIDHLINLIRQDKIIHTCYYWVIVYLRPNYEFEKIYNRDIEYNIHIREGNINMSIANSSIKSGKVCWIYMNNSDFVNRYKEVLYIVI